MTSEQGMLPLNTTPTTNIAGPPHGRAFPLWLVLALAALAVPRVVAHDLRLAPPNGLINALLVFVPPLIWLAVILWRRPAHPFLTLMLIGFCYGVMLAIGHQIMWAAAFGDNPPQLGGTLAGRLDPAVENLVLRGAAFISSVVTGTVVGAIVGGIGAVLTRLLRLPTRA
jgi:hypothetical protein